LKKLLLAFHYKVQTKKLDKATPSLCLSQGHIFDLSQVRFKLIEKDDQGREIEAYKSFKDFYPYADFNTLRYGIVINQACDLAYKDKIPYLTVGVLEPIDGAAFDVLSPGFIKDNFRDFSGRKVYARDVFTTDLAKELRDLIQNNTEGNHLHFFISLDETPKTYFYLNLTKLFPIRGEHYNEILKWIEYEVIGDFQHLIGWKLAHLYGRVGVQNYSADEISLVVEEIAPHIVSGIQKRLNAELLDVKTKDNFSQIKVSLGAISNPKSAVTTVERELTKVTEILAKVSGTN